MLLHCCIWHDRFNIFFFPNNKRLCYQDGQSVTYNGKKGIWVHIKYISFGTDIDLVNAGNILKSLEDDNWFDLSTYKMYVPSIFSSLNIHIKLI